MTPIGRRFVDKTPADAYEWLVLNRWAPDECPKDQVMEHLVHHPAHPRPGEQWTPEALDRLMAAINEVPRSRTVRAAQLAWWRVQDLAARFRAWVVGRP